MTGGFPESDAVLQQVEATEFAVQVGSASSAGGALETISRDRRVQELTRTLHEDRDLEFELLNRVRVHSSATIDERFFSHHDVAVAAYLYCLWRTDLSTFGAALEAVEAKADRYWWANPIGALLYRRAQEISISTSERVPAEERRAPTSAFDSLIFVWNDHDWLPLKRVAWEVRTSEVATSPIESAWSAT